jgi:hypothetical protein
VFWPERDANPFFHLLEALWMLDGRNDVAFPASILPSIAQFSDDGKVFHGAYGHRWRRHFGIDQLLSIARMLNANPDDRQAVLSMWDTNDDFGRVGKDLPCNTHAYLSRDENGALDLMVCNRSNDSVWGALGANCVHFSVMQEFVAGVIGCTVGRYWQVSSNMHLYTEKHEDLMNTLADRAFPSTSINPYEAGIMTTPLLPQGNPTRFLSDLNIFLSEGFVLGVTDPFIARVAAPMARALKVMKEEKAPEKFNDALTQLSRMPRESDWRVASEQWIERRRVAWETKNSSQQ